MMRIFDFSFCRQYDPMAMMVVASVAAGSTIAGGISGNQAAGDEAAMQRQQGAVALSEAQTNASNEGVNQTHAIQNQRLAFLANGVSLEGSPSAVLAASKAYGQQQVQSILDQGTAQYNLAQQQAAITKNKGRAALVASVSQAGQQVASAGYKGYQSGMFDPTLSQRFPGGVSSSSGRTTTVT